jgi:hypothetical protein
MEEPGATPRAYAYTRASRLLDSHAREKRQRAESE